MGDGGLILSNNARYLFASESDYGVDAVEPMINDDSVDLVYQQTPGIDITPTGETVHVARERASVSGNKHGFIEGRCEVSGTIPLLPYVDASTQTPHYAPVLKAMGLAEDLSTQDEAHYTPSTVQQPSLTIYKFMRLAESDQWRLKVATGVRLGGTISWEVNGEPSIEIEGAGLYESVREPEQFFDPSTGELALLKDGQTTPPDRSSGSGNELVADQDPLLTDGMACDVDGNSHVMQSAELSMNHDVTQVQATTSDASTVKHIITRANQDSRIAGSFNFSDYSDSDLDGFISDYESAKEMALSMGAQNANGRVELDAPKAQIGIVGMSDADGVQNLEVPFMLNGDWSDLSADNDFDLGYVAPN